LCEPGKFLLNPYMPFDEFPGALEDEGTGRMKDGKIRVVPF
jgi:hypothetical protein